VNPIVIAFCIFGFFFCLAWLGALYINIARFLRDSGMRLAGTDAVPHRSARGALVDHFTTTGIWDGLSRFATVTVYERGILVEGMMMRPFWIIRRSITAVERLTPLPEGATRIRCRDAGLNVSCGAAQHDRLVAWWRQGDR